MHFARTLRAAGLPVGPGKVLDAVAAVRRSASPNRRDFYWTLHAVFVNRPDQRELFDQAFHVFWRNPELLKKMMALVLPEMSLDLPEDEKSEMLRRLAEALHPQPEGARDRRDRARIRRGDDLLRPRAAARDGFREDVAATSWRAPRRRSPGCSLPVHDRADPALRARPARRPRRYARDVARRAALGRPHRAEAQEPRAAGRRRWSSCATSPAR